MPLRLFFLAMDNVLKMSYPLSFMEFSSDKSVFMYPFDEGIVIAPLHVLSFVNGLFRYI